MSVSDATSQQQSVFGTAPSDWVVDRIRDRLGVIVGGEWGDDPEAHDEGVEIPVIRVADIRGLDVKTDELTIRRVKESKLPGRLIGKRTILLEKSGGGEQKPVGRAVLGRKIDFDAICSNFMAKTDCEMVNPLFVAYLLDAAYSGGINTAHIQQTTGIQNLRITHYLNTHVAFPSLSEQQRIAAYLDASCAAIDAAVAAKRKQFETLDEVRKSTIHRAVTQGLPSDAKMKPADLGWLSEVPEHWTASRIRNVSRLSPGYSGTPPTHKEMCAVVPMELVSETGEIDTTSSQAFEDIPSGLTLFETGDVLFAKITPCMENGKGAFVRNLPTRYAFGSTEFHVMRPYHSVNAKFLYFYTFNPIFRAYAAENMFGAAGQKRVSSRFIKDTRIFLPPTQEQFEIVAFLEAKIAELGMLSEQIERQIETLVAYRKSLIHECVTGQRRISEADMKALSGKFDTIHEQQDGGESRA
jgi:type I restriction enzyme, S subunit